MKRKLLLPLLLCCMFANPAQAGILSDSINRVETAYPFYVASMLPLPDGGVILAGQVYYPSAYRTPDMPEIDRLTKNVTEDGYAICLNEDGTKRWDFYGGMPDQWNNCMVLCLLPDGRALLSIRHVTELNHRMQQYSFYYIDAQGNAEKDEELAIRIAETFDPETLKMVSEGFIGGANSELAAWNGEFPTDAVLLDFDQREVWRHDPSDIAEIFWLEIAEEAEGILLYGSWRNEHATESAAVIRKLDQAGNEVWTFNEASAGPSSGVYSLAALPDGSIVFRSIYSPDGLRLDSDNYPHQTLTRLDRDGNHLWSRFFDEEGYSMIGGLQPLGDGIVLGATVLFPEHDLLLLDSDGNILGKAHYGEVEDGELGNMPSLVRGQDGSVYIFGTLHEKVPLTSLTGGKVICSFYGKIDEDMFQ